MLWLGLFYFIRVNFIQAITPMKTAQYRLIDYPEGRRVADFWQLSHDPVQQLASGQVKLRVDWISVDPGMSGWITNKRSYMPPVKPGEVMRAFGVGEVIESSCDTLTEGDVVTGFTGVTTHAVLPARHLRIVDTTVAPAQLYLSALGMTGYTAYFGMTDIGRPQPGETVVVSSAAGAVGSIAAQLAAQHGARVVGIAGGPQKKAFLLDELQLDAAIDYRNEEIAAALKKTAPAGIDVYFDNVGGEILDAALMQMNRHGRIVVCGGISQYSDWEQASGPANYMQIVTHSLTMQGFTMRDYMDRISEALTALFNGYQDGSLKFRQHVLEGIERFPEAYDMLFNGHNQGKLLIKIT